MRDAISHPGGFGRLYESQPYHNAVFIGFDRKGAPKYSTLRGTTNRRYMGEANGSDKHFSFSIPSLEESTPPAALMQYLKDFPQINEIALHLDNDTAGRLAAMTIQAILPSAYIISDEPPKRGKDMNDYLKITLGLQRLQEIERL
ncbi:DUF3991 domain-containing protein [Desulfosporosinus burensis]